MIAVLVSHSDLVVDAVDGLLFLRVFADKCLTCMCVCVCLSQRHAAKPEHRSVSCLHLHSNSSVVFLQSSAIRIVLFLLSLPDETRADSICCHLTSEQCSPSARSSKSSLCPPIILLSAATQPAERKFQSVKAKGPPVTLAVRTVQPMDVGGQVCLHCARLSAAVSLSFFYVTLGGNTHTHTNPEPERLSARDLSLSSLLVACASWFHAVPAFISFTSVFQFHLPPPFCKAPQKDAEFCFCHRNLTHNVLVHSSPPCV